MRAEITSTTLAAQLLKSRVRAAELADLGGAGFELSPLEWDDLAHAEDLIAGVQGVLKTATPAADPWLKANGEELLQESDLR